jgi:hypothetical protein
MQRCIYLKAILVTREIMTKKDVETTLNVISNNNYIKTIFEDGIRGKV